MFQTTNQFLDLKRPCNWFLGAGSKLFWGSRMDGVKPKGHFCSQQRRLVVLDHLDAQKHSKWEF
jgi:hypothetical protein